MFVSHWKTASIALLLAAIPWSGMAQIEKHSDDAVAAIMKDLPALRTSAANPAMKALLGKSGTMSEKEQINAVRVAKALGGFDGKVVHYAVPAMSEVQRLADEYPIDGKIFGTVRIIMAQDEYEPGSFVVYPLADEGKVEFKLTPFKTADGKVFPADKLDLKVIKVWYQNGNGWYSYFGDTGLKLTPELLLNDEDLFKVDTEKVQNYARVLDEKGNVSWLWVTPPLEIDKRYFFPSYRSAAPFQYMRKGFEDAGTLQPVTLNGGEFKQFFLTVHAVKDQAPGLYKGAVEMVKNGQKLGAVPVTVKVLPFALPKPCSYADTDKPFLVSAYSYDGLDNIYAQNGGDFEHAVKILKATFANHVSHNQDMHMTSNPFTFQGALYEKLMREAGMRSDYLMGGSVLGKNRLDMEHYAKLQREHFTKLGYKDIFIGYGDEPPARWVVANRNVFEAYQKNGMKFFIAGGNQVFYSGGYFYDFFNTAKDPEDREATRLWNEVGHAWVAWYATHHVGPENPAFTRRQYGMAPYLANYSAICNYAHHYGSYNDRRETYKPMVFAYGTYGGVIDTLGWEGFREGIDDIRYATMLKRLAKEAIANKDDIKIRYAGQIVHQFFAELENDSADLNEARLEMINHILKLRAILKK